MYNLINQPNDILCVPHNLVVQNEFHLSLGMKTHRREIKMKCNLIDLINDNVWTKTLTIQLDVGFDGLYVTP